ncbi:stalk domain-containing protein [Fusobacterium sp. PH5-44]|uniref:stalk domain-containing protein n=1 Tax=unclassified Fusobacterium TaxID=2648384 RepID=UPI003D1CE949
MKKIFLFILVIISFTTGLASSVVTTYDTFKTKTVLKDEFLIEKYNRGLISFEYCLFSPVNTSNKKLPLVLILEPSDSDTAFNSIIQTSKTVLLAKDFRNKNNSYAIIVKLPSKVDSYSAEDYNNGFIDLIDGLVKLGKVDKNKIYAYSSGVGSDILYSFIAKNSLYFTAVTIINGNPQNHRVEIAKNLPINILQSVDNPAFNNSISAYNKLVDMNNRNIVYSLFPSSTILNKNKASNLKNNFNWMYNFVKQKTSVLSSGKEGLLIVNGNKISEKPKRIKSNTLVSIPDVAKVLGYEAKFADGSKNIYELSKDKKLSIDLNNGKVFINGNQEKYFIPASPNNAVPLIRADFFARYMNATVKLNNTGAGFQVIVTSN